MLGDVEVGRVGDPGVAGGGAAGGDLAALGGGLELLARQRVAVLVLDVRAGEELDAGALLVEERAHLLRLEAERAASFAVRSTCSPTTLLVVDEGGLLFLALLGALGAERGDWRGRRDRLALAARRPVGGADG